MQKDQITVAILISFYLSFLAPIHALWTTVDFDPTKEIEAYRMNDSDELMLDGQMNDAVWDRAMPISDFLMQEPVEGHLPSERTEVRIAYDEQNLYIAANFFDSEPSDIKAYQKKRDALLTTDDRFQLILDTHLDGRNAYFFAVNPNGVMQDGLIVTGQGSRLSLDWDGIWRVWSKVHTLGWSVEIRIPFRTLNFDPVNERWGINFKRVIRRKSEELVWSGHKRSQGLLRPQNAGILSGIKEITQGIGLEGVPYTAARRLQIRDGDELKTEYEGDFGFDMNYNITPRLKASFTYNTDFAEAEVDSRRINLTRFPLLFPEKRNFFLEGSSIYSFAASSGVRPYFSRSIGLNEGRSIPIRGGARLLGRVGTYDIAVQHVLTAGVDIIPSENFTVARIKKNIGKESRIGFIYTRRTTNGGDELVDPLQDRHTIGADVELNTSQFLGDKNFQFQGFFVYHNPANPFHTSNFWDRTARGIRINFPNRPWSGHASYREFDVAFDPALGFQSRVGFRRFQPNLAFSPLFEKSSVIRGLDMDFRFEHLMDMDWTLLTQNIRFDIIDVQFESSERFTMLINKRFERLTDAFDILRDESIVIPVGDYHTWEISAIVETGSQRPISTVISYQAGGFWSGNRSIVSSTITIRPIPGIGLTGTYSHTNVDLEEGEFDTNLFRFSASFDLTTFLSFSSFIQWDDLSDQLGINNRFRWIVSPGNDVFIVYNQNWEDYLERFRTLNSTATMKATYTHRF